MGYRTIGRDGYRWRYLFVELGIGRSMEGMVQTEGTRYATAVVGGERQTMNGNAGWSKGDLNG